MKSLAPLTARQAEALTFIAEHIAAHGYGPTHREVGSALGISSRPAHMLIKALEEKGWIRCEPRRHRAITILRSPVASRAA